jgi:hypothetical protein
MPLPGRPLTCVASQAGGGLGGGGASSGGGAAPRPKLSRLPKVRAASASPSPTESSQAAGPAPAAAPPPPASTRGGLGTAFDSTRSFAGSLWSSIWGDKGGPTPPTNAAPAPAVLDGPAALADKVRKARERHWDRDGGAPGQCGWVRAPRVAPAVRRAAVFGADRCGGIGRRVRAPRGRRTPRREKNKNKPPRTAVGVACPPHPTTPARCGDVHRTGCVGRRRPAGRVAHSNPGKMGFVFVLRFFFPWLHACGAASPPPASRRPGTPHRPGQVGGHVLVPDPGGWAAGSGGGRRRARTSSSFLARHLRAETARRARPRPHARATRRSGRPRSSHTAHLHHRPSVSPSSLSHTPHLPLSHTHPHTTPPHHPTGRSRRSRRRSHPAHHPTPRHPALPAPDRPHGGPLHPHALLPVRADVLHRQADGAC